MTSHETPMTHEAHRIPAPRTTLEACVLLLLALGAAGCQSLDAYFSDLPDLGGEWVTSQGCPVTIVQEVYAVTVTAVQPADGQRWKTAVGTCEDPQNIKVTLMDGASEVERLQGIVRADRARHGQSIEWRDGSRWYRPQVARDGAAVAAAAATAAGPLLAFGNWRRSDSPHPVELRVAGGKVVGRAGVTDDLTRSGFRWQPLEGSVSEQRIQLRGSTADNRWLVGVITEQGRQILWSDGSEWVFSKEE